MSSASILLLYTVIWTIVLMLVVAVASFSAEFAFVSAVISSPSSSLSQSCEGHELIKIPVEVSGQVTCLPASMVRRSGFDVFVPILCLAFVVVGSAFMLRAVGFMVDVTDYDNSDDTEQQLI
ncbi:hypothetical protein DCAR_0205968 [Daucus carota subsp. sativus]|uniref:Transmembrane protein n=1 Tax=Daucus carota subsp. sativus TaxID=79200 RepID=A0A166CXW9_DAUCS|nr:hypothetical protein DCAR_0205968 [Daucus carota subsp. sativus]